MTTRLPRVDVVLVGFGWTAAIIGQELTDAGLQVLALERGKFRETVPDFATPHIQDELRYAVRHALFERPARETLTFRNSTIGSPGEVVLARIAGMASCVFGGR